MRIREILIVAWASFAGVYVSAEETEAKPYPNAQLLMEPQQLADGTAGIVVIDVRDRASYETGHVPGAIAAPHEDWQRDFAKSSESTSWSKRIGALGIDGKKPVVLYDDASGNDAARVWFILRYFGVKDVRLLNGFWKGWKSGNFSIETKDNAPAPVTFTAKPNAKLRATKEQILGQLSKGSTDRQILDARSLEEHLGTNKLKNPRGGHLPDACHLDWVEVIDTKGTQRFKSAPELKALLKKAGVDIQKPIITHCQGGGRSAVMMFTVNLLGGNDVANYYESFGEWSKDSNAPVIEGEPGQRR